MAKMVTITGVRGIIENLRKLEKAQGSRLTGGIMPHVIVERGLPKAGLFLQRSSQEIVPVDKNILKPSANTRKEGSGWKTVVTVSYTTAYAVYVHERTDLKNKPGQEAKFLEKPAREKRGEILRIIKNG